MNLGSVEGIHTALNGPPKRDEASEEYLASLVEGERGDGNGLRPQMGGGRLFPDCFQLLPAMSG